MRFRYLAPTALLMLSLTTGVARAETYATISGRVTDASGAPVANLCVYGFSEDSEPYRVSTTTAADGTYELDIPDEDSYRRWVDFWNCHQVKDASGAILVSEVYDDAPYYGEEPPGPAKDVLVSAGEHITGIDAVLDAPSVIRGTVSDADGPVEGVCVRAEFKWSDPTTYWYYAGQVQTRSDGTYEVGGLHSGTYRIRFAGCGDTYATEWNGDQPAASDVVALEVGRATTTSGIDAQLQVGGAISGIVLRRSRIAERME